MRTLWWDRDAAVACGFERPAAPKQLTKRGWIALNQVRHCLVVIFGNGVRECTATGVAERVAAQVHCFQAAAGRHCSRNGHAPDVS